MEVRASGRYLPISAQKMRLVINQVRGMDADQALIVLKYMPQKGAGLAYKVVASAIANAEENFELNRQDLYIEKIFSDGAASQRRVKAGARGRYKPRVKRTSHLTVVLKEYDYQKMAVRKEKTNDGA